MTPHDLAAEVTHLRAEISTMATRQKELVEIVDKSNAIVANKLATLPGFVTQNHCKTTPSSVRKSTVKQKHKSTVKSIPQPRKKVSEVRCMPPQQFSKKSRYDVVASETEQNYDNLCQMFRQPPTQASLDLTKTSEVKLLLSQFDTMRQLLNSDPHLRHMFAEYDYRLNEIRDELDKTTTVYFNNTHRVEKLKGVIEQARAQVEQQIEQLTSDCKSEHAFIDTLLAQVPQVIT